MNWLALLGLDVIVARWRVAAIEGAIAVEDRMELARAGVARPETLHPARIGAGHGGGWIDRGEHGHGFHGRARPVWDTPYRSVAGWVVAGVWLAAWLACSSRYCAAYSGGRRISL